MGVCDLGNGEEDDSNTDQDLHSAFTTEPLTPPSSAAVPGTDPGPIGGAAPAEGQRVQSVTEDALDAAIKDATAEEKRVFVCLFASFKEDEPEVRWCPDCVDAEPVIDQAFASAAAECHLIKVDITRNSWKVEPGPAHPYRSEPFNAGGIPKLLLLGSDGSVVKGFAEEECKTLDTMKSAFNQS